MGSRQRRKISGFKQNKNKADEIIGNGEGTRNKMKNIKQFANIKDMGYYGTGLGLGRMENHRLSTSVCVGVR